MLQMREWCRCNSSSIFGKNEFSFVFLTSEQDTSNSYHLTISSLKSQIYTISGHLVRGTICLISFSILQDLKFGLLQTMRSKALKRLTSQITIYSPVVPFFDMSFGNNLPRTNRRQSERRARETDDASHEFWRSSSLVARLARSTSRVTPTEGACLYDIQ